MDMRLANNFDENNCYAVPWVFVIGTTKALKTLTIVRTVAADGHWNCFQPVGRDVIVKKD